MTHTECIIKRQLLWEQDPKLFQTHQKVACLTIFDLFSFIFERQLYSSSIRAVQLKFKMSFITYSKIIIIQLLCS